MPEIAILNLNLFSLHSRGEMDPTRLCICNSPCGHFAAPLHSLRFFLPKYPVRLLLKKSPRTLVTVAVVVVVVVVIILVVVMIIVVAAAELSCCAHSGGLRFPSLDRDRQTNTFRAVLCHMCIASSNTLSHSHCFLPSMNRPPLMSL